MRELKNMQARLKYQGGILQEQRMIRDKERSLKSALWFSYQGETAVLQDGREFRCLINPDKEYEGYDMKEISIPFEDYCLNNGKRKKKPEVIGMASGDVFKWKQTDTYWLVYLRKLEENAYFRASIRKCTHEVDVNGHKYHVYVQGPLNTTIQWHTKSKVYFNDLSYQMTMYITKNQETIDYFKRFSMVKIDGKPWQTQVEVDENIDGIVKVQLKEYFSNTILEQSIEEKNLQIEQNEPQNSTIINGPKEVYPYEKIKYSVNNIRGAWAVQSGAKILNATENEVEIEITRGRSGIVELWFKSDEDEEIYKIDIDVKSL